MFISLVPWEYQLVEDLYIVQVTFICVETIIFCEDYCLSVHQLNFLKVYSYKFS